MPLVAVAATPVPPPQPLTHVAATLVAIHAPMAMLVQTHAPQTHAQLAMLVQTHAQLATLVQTHAQLVASKSYFVTSPLSN